MGDACSSEVVIAITNYSDLVTMMAYIQTEKLIETTIVEIAAN